MENVKLIKFLTVIVPVIVITQVNGDTGCTLESTGSPGICKLITDCQSARDDLVKNNRLPQTCAFKGTQTVVCCPTKEKRKPGTISKIRCREYSSYAYANEKSSDVTQNECGHKIVKRIVGGIVASRKEFPHMAVIGFKNGDEILWSCGGTIISDKYILTAGHCLRDTPMSPVLVKVGVTSLNDTDHKQEIKIAEILPHPEHKQIMYNDIGLLRLDSPIQLNSYARPACLNADSEISVEKAVATGWGSTSFAGAGSNDLLKVTLDITDYDSCNKTYYTESDRRLRNGIDRETQLCAGSENGGKDTCAGDAGGPLQIYHQGDDITCMYDIVGITSFGKLCGAKSTPAVYTKVAAYIKWIEDIVWPESS